MTAFVLSWVTDAHALPPKPAENAEGADEDKGARVTPTASEEQRLAGWTIVGAGLLFTLVGITAGFRIDDLDKSIDEKAGTADLDDERLQELLDKQDIFQGLQLVGLIGGAALAIGGVSLLIMDARQKPPSRFSVSPWVGPGGAGVTVEGGF